MSSIDLRQHNRVTLREFGRFITLKVKDVVLETVVIVDGSFVLHLTQRITSDNALKEYIVIAFRRQVRLHVNKN
jgi:hypothetical protein